jgi:CPA2 family monovalent cation:H+ antiporter-2
MHGFYPGETTMLTAETATTLLFLHAVPLPCDAYAINKTLAELKLDDLDVSVRAVRRDDQESTSITGDFCLQCDDVLVLAGRPHAIEAAEAFLLNG